MQATPGYDPPPPDMRRAAKMDELAVVSLVLAIVGVPFMCCCAWVSLATSIGAVVCGFLSLGKLKADPTRSGKGMAIAGIALGGLTALVFIAWMVLGLGTTVAAMIAGMMQQPQPR